MHESKVRSRLKIHFPGIALPNLDPPASAVPPIYRPPPRALLSIDQRSAPHTLHTQLLTRLGMKCIMHDV